MTITTIKCPKCGGTSIKDSNDKEVRGVYFCSKCVYAHRPKE